MKTPKVQKEQESFFTKRREPFAFMLWVGMAGIMAIFLILSFLYALRRESQIWTHFQLPVVFWVSTFLILLSSLSLHWARDAFKKEKFRQYTQWLGLTLGLGGAFIGTQLLGWWQLLEQGIILENNISGAFLYLITGLHIVHLVGGIFFLALIFIEAIQRNSYVDAFIYSVNPPNQLRLRLITVYWHFVDFLWLYLFLFFFFNR